MSGIEAGVPVPSSQGVERQRRVHGERISRERRAGRHHECQRRDKPGSDPREGTALANRLAHAAHVGRLQVPQPAVKGFQMIEGRRAAASASKHAGVASIPRVDLALHRTDLDRSPEPKAYSPASAAHRSVRPGRSSPPGRTRGPSAGWTCPRARGRGQAAPAPEYESAQAC